jgi:hypothetical protein
VIGFRTGFSGFIEEWQAAGRVLLVGGMGMVNGMMMPPTTVSVKLIDILFQFDWKGRYSVEPSAT